MILVVGATGMVGSEICRRLVAEGRPVRALVRETADPAKVLGLEEHTVEIVRGDLRDPASLGPACRGVDAVITTVSAMPFSYQPGKNDIQTTDVDGQLRLLEAARDAGVRHFTYTSFSKNLDRACPLRNAKRTVEAAVMSSGLEYTILRPSAFMEVWLGPAGGFDYPNARATIYGDGTKPVGWIAIADVAEFAVRSLDAPAAANAILELGGPRSIPALEVVEIFERTGGRPFERQFVPIEAIDAQVAAANNPPEGAPDPMAVSFVTLMRSMADGDPIEMTEVLAGIPVALTSVEEYAASVLAAGKVTAPAG